MTSAIKTLLPCGGDGKESLRLGWLWLPLWWEDDGVLFALCCFASLSIVPPLFKAIGESVSPLHYILL